MFSDRLTNHGLFRALIPVIAVVLLSTAFSAWCDCTQKYPASDVTAELNQFALQNCTLATIVESYTKLLEEQHQLIKSLKPAYSRKLKKMVESASISNETGDLRLTDYDTSLSNLLTHKQALGTWISEWKQAPVTESAQEKKIRMQSSLQAILPSTSKAIQAAYKKVKQTTEEITESESNNFCKLDFKIRVSQKLKKMIETCLSTN